MSSSGNSAAADTKYGVPVAQIAGEWDVSTLTAADGTSVAFLPDLSSNGHGLRSLLPAAQPVLGTEAGKRHLAFAAGQFLSNVGFGNGGAQPNGWPQPLTLVAVSKANVTPANGATPRRMVGFVTQAVALSLAFDFNCPAIFASVTGAQGGAPLNDGAWHINIGVLDITSGSVWVDGFLVGTTSTQAHGANSMKGVSLGADGNGANGLDGFMRHAFVISGRLTPKQVATMTAALAAKWGMS